VNIIILNLKGDKMKKRNRKSFGTIINWQYAKEKDCKAFSGEASPYWEHMERTVKPNHPEEGGEFPQANPDMLAEDGEEYNVRRERYQHLIEDTLKDLSPRENQVFTALGNGKTEREIAKTLNVSRSCIAQCRKRLIKKFEENSIKTS
jgi:RNA polymerase sigma factor (sigma-70 family)